MRKAKEDLDRRGEEQRGESTKRRRCEEQQKKKRQDWSNQLKRMPTDTRSLKRQGVESLLKPHEGARACQFFYV